ncbi:MAG TPA: ribulose-phosphate 3-epimerase [Candidatus Dormibacteraeota bacterium]|nr:ribulose-phosphate 3-epimerase [Candidatus Dormibacteraeota bacterium]
MLIAPSLLSADFSRLGEEVAALELAGADWVHFDVMDGHFVPPITIGARTVEHCRRYAKLPFDVHLMIENPERYIEAFRDAGANTLSVHVEATRHIHRVLDSIRAAGLKPGVCLNPGSPLALLEPVMKEADLLVMMSVNPGWGGQHFIEASLARIQAARAMRDRLNPKLEIEVDGGVTAQTGRAAREAGATVLVAGNFVYTHPRGKHAAIAELR